MRNRELPGLLVGLLLLATAGTASAAQYTVTSLGTLGGTHGDAYDVNSSGHVVGYAANAANVKRPFLWSQSGGMRDLGTLAGGTGTTGRCYGINDLGWGVGTSENGGSVVNATLWRPGQSPQDLGDLTGFTQSYATAVNNAGQVVGVASKLVGSDLEQRAFLWTESGGMVDLGTLGGTGTAANAISDNGLIVGSSELTGSAVHAFSCTNSSNMTDIYGDFSGRDYTANGANASGAVVGQAEKADGSKVPALWSTGSGEPAFADVAYGWAEDINDGGMIVGRYRETSYSDPTLPFVWDGGGSLVALPHLEEGGSYTVEAINNAGWIAGHGTADGHEVPLLWVPEPATLSLLAIGGLAMIRRRNRKGAKR